MSAIQSAVSYDDVRDSIAVAKSHGEKFFEQIVWQVENEAWTVLGYESWDEMRAAEYADMGVVAPRADRPELVSRLRARGLTQQQIADTVGTSKPTVHRVLREVSDETSPAVITNSLGDERPATYQPREPEPERATPVEYTPRPEPITNQFSAVITDLNRLLDRFHQISTNRNFTNNKNQVATLHGSDLARAISELQTIADALN